MKSVSFLKKTLFFDISIPVKQYRLGALLTGFYDCSGLPGAPRASADVLGRSPRPPGLPAALPATGADPERIPRVDPVLGGGT